MGANKRGSAPTRAAAFERAGTVPVLGVVIALIAMLLVPATAAQAAPGDLAHGVVYADANQDGAISSGPVGEEDRGLAGVTVNVLDIDGNVLASTVTGPDGSWSILEADVTGDPVSVEILTAGANADVYATYAATSADNDFARAGSPNRATAPLGGGTDVELNALVYPVWKLDAQLADDPDGVGGKSIITGTPTFDGGDTEPGEDSGTTNTRVRSADIVAFNWTLTAESEDGSLGESFTDAVFEQTISLVDGAVANFAGIPAVCEAGSQIVAYPSGTVIDAKTDPPAGTTSVTLSCVLGEMGVAPAPSAIILGTQVQPSAKSPNGSSFETSSRFYAVDGNGAATAQPAPGPEVPPIEITAAPRYDVEKVSGGSNYARSMVIDGETVHGIGTYYNIKISTDRKVGVEAFEQPLEIEESFWATRSVEGPNGEPVGATIDDLKWYLMECVPASTSTSQGLTPTTLVGGRIGANADATAANSVRDSGTCAPARTGAADTGNYTLTLDGIDTSGLTYPTQTVGGQSLAAGPYYVASYRIQVFIPYSEVDRMQGDASDGVGELSAFNRVGDFDPDGVSGASNFGSGVEPGYCEAGPGSDQAVNCDLMEDGTRSNNVAGPLTVRMSPGNWGKYFYDNRAAWAISVTTLPSSSGTHNGDGQVQPGQAFTSVMNLNNTALAWTSVEQCDVFDNTVLKLAPLDSDATTNGSTWGDGTYSAVLADGRTVAANQADQANWVFRYGTVDLSGDIANTGVFDVATNRYEGDWSNQRQASNGASAACADPGITWHSDPNDVPGGIDAINVVHLASVPGHIVDVGTYSRWYLTFEQRDEYFGGPNDGEKIPAGTIAANFGSVKTSGYHPNWSTANYVPGAGTTAPLPTGQDRHAGENGSVQGDRWTVARAQMRLQKQTVAGEVDGEAASGVAAFGVTGAAVAGKPVIWEITSTLTAASEDPAPVNEVVITDTLPEYVIYSESGTQALATAEGFPMPTSVTPNGDGTTTIVWNLGTRTPNQDLPLLKIATHTDPMAPPNTTAVNNAAITADGVTPVSAHTDDHTIRIEQSGQVQLKKSVDRTLDLQNDDQQYTLELKNFSETLAIQAPTIYDVLPYNGDATNAANVNRTPGSDHAGSNRLSAAPVATDFDGTTPRAGTFYYTTVPGAQVPQRQQDDTDPSIWSTTFTENATGFKFVSATPLTTTANASTSGIKIAFQTDQASNDPGDIYTNRFTVISSTLNNGNQLLTSNTVSVRVVGFSIGDLVWIDNDGDGRYTAGTDTAAPAGVTVRLYEGSQGDDTGPSLRGETTTDADGRWHIDDLPRGTRYFVVIPASEFAAGGPLEGYIPAPNPVADPNTDANENADHHAVWFSGWDSIPAFSAANEGAVMSAGDLALDADVDADPITGLEPLGDNVAGLILAPLTTDDFTNLTLDLALLPPVEFTVEKVVDGEAAEWGNGPFTIEVTCLYEGETVSGFPQTVTIGAGETSDPLRAPLGSDCTATETADGGATSVVIDPQDGLTLDSVDGEFVFTVTNTFDAGSFDIEKQVEGVGAGLEEERSFTFTAVCTFQGQTVLDETITLTSPDGLRSDEITGIPVGASCVITETDNGGADATPAAVTLTIDGDPETVQTAGFVNEYSAGEVSLLKVMAGDSAEDEFLAGLEYEVWVTCAIGEDAEDRLLFFDGTVWLVPGEKLVLEVDGEPLQLPIGAHCWIDGETVDQSATEVEYSNDSYENALVVAAGEPDEVQELALSLTNTFDTASLTVSKTVVGPDPGGPYTFELQCLYPVDSGDGVSLEEYPLAEEDASFVLRHGESRTIQVIAGVNCRVVETDIPAGATVTILDSDDTTPGGGSDGAVSDLRGDDNTVAVTNAFPEPPLSTTGGQSLVFAAWAAGGLLLVGAVILLIRRRKAGEKTE